MKFNTKSLLVVAALLSLSVGCFFAAAPKSSAQEYYSDDSGYGGGYSDSSGYGSYYSDDSGYGGGYSDYSGYGSYYSDASGYGGGYSDYSGYGNYYSDASGYGSGYSDNSGYGSYYSDASGYGSGYGDYFSDASGYGSGYGSYYSDNSGYGSTYNDSVYSDSVYSNSTYSDSVYSDSTYSNSVYSSATYGDCCTSNAPTYSTPTYSTPTYSTPTYSPCCTSNPPTYQPPVYQPPVCCNPPVVNPPVCCNPPVVNPPVCCNPPVTPPAPISLYCAANVSSADIGQTVTWTAYPSGGNGSYTYAWIGNENLTGNSSSVSKAYAIAGQKGASVTVTSNGQSKTAECATIVINQPTNPPQNNLVISCYASQTNIQVGQNVSWYANVSGGYAQSYSWSGTDGLSGSSATVSKTYYAPGTKTAYVTVYGTNGQAASANCSTYVGQNVIGGNVTVYSTPGDVPLSGAVYLSEVPYTGLEDWNWKFIGFFSVLALWSAGVAYALLRKKAVQNLEVADASIAAYAPIIAEVVAPEATTEEVEAAARSKNMILSEDAVAFIKEKAFAEKRIAGEVVAMIADKIGAGQGSWKALSKASLLSM